MFKFIRKLKQPYIKMYRLPDAALASEHCWRYSTSEITISLGALLERFIFIKIRNGQRDLLIGILAIEPGIFFKYYSSQIWLSNLWMGEVFSKEDILGFQDYSYSWSVWGGGLFTNMGLSKAFKHVQKHEGQCWISTMLTIYWTNLQFRKIHFSEKKISILGKFYELHITCSI